MVNFITMKKYLLSFLMLPVAAMAQPAGDAAVIKKISDEILRNGKAYDLLYQLTKQIGARLSGSPEFAKAVKWGENAMRQNGADNVWLQECMIPHWVRGGNDKAFIIEVDKNKTSRPLDVLALGNSLGKGTVTGEVLAVQDFDELERRKDEVKVRSFITTTVLILPISNLLFLMARPAFTAAPDPAAQLNTARWA